MNSSTNSSMPTNSSIPTNFPALSVKSTLPINDISYNANNFTTTTTGKKRKKASKQSPNTKKQKSRAEFVIKLFEFLKLKQHIEIISWHKDGFIIWNVEKFTEIVLPLLFKHKKFQSFVRQLNFYSFTKIAVETNTSSSSLPSSTQLKKNTASKWQHPEFTEHSTLEQISQIRRTTSPKYSTEGLAETLKTNCQNNKIVAQQLSVWSTRLAGLRLRLNLLPVVVKNQKKTKIVSRTSTPTQNTENTAIKTAIISTATNSSSSNSTTTATTTTAATAVQRQFDDINNQSLDFQRMKYNSTNEFHHQRQQQQRQQRQQQQDQRQDVKIVNQIVELKKKIDDLHARLAILQAPQYLL